MAKSTKPITPEQWDRVIDWLHEGYNLTEIAEFAGMPSRATMTRYLHKDEILEQRIAHARHKGWDTRAERVTKEAVQAADPALGRLALDANRWLLSKMNPDKYGEKIRNELSGPGGGPITVASGTADLPDAIAEILKLARDRAEDDGDLA